MSESIENLMKSCAEGKILEDAAFEKQTFADFNLRPRKGTHAILRNISFHKCKTVSKRNVILRGSVLEDVKFVDFNCGGPLHIDSDNVLLNRVAFEGKRHPKALFIKPSIESEGKTGQFSNPDFNLDISNYHGEVDIIGVDVDNVITDPDRHAKLKIADFKTVNWNELGISNGDLFKILFDRVVDFNAEEAILDVSIKNEDYTAHIEQLRKLGLLS